MSELVSIASLVFDPANARKHDKKNLDAIKGSLARFGQQKPIVISKDNVVIAGNGTLAAARELGWNEIEVKRSKLTGVEAIAYALADNRSAELAAWDDEILGKTLHALQEDGFPIADIGFDPGDFWEEKNEGLTDPDEIPEVPQNVRGVLRGQIWQLGDHRMMCGDSTSKDDVERLISGEVIDMVFTDPPYGINEPCNRADHIKTFKKKGLIETKTNFKQIIGDEDTETATKAIEICLGLNISCQIFWGGNYYPLEPSATWIVWDKRVEEKQSNIRSDCELAWVKHKHKKSVRIFRHLWNGMIKASEKSQARVHPTQKPIALAEWCFENYDEPKSVLDLFLGSGSTLIACEKTNRKCFGMEIDPHYCSVIIERFEKFSGKKAILCSGINQENQEAIDG
jgi:DNA modification methylase